MRAFALIWFGQLVSLIGSGLTGFALGVSMLETSGSVTQYGFVVISTMLPSILLAPFVGPLVDRWDRRWVMILSDTGAGLSTLAVALMFLTRHAEFWSICSATAIGSAFSAFQWPAYSAATTMLVPKEHLGRANGMIQAAQAFSQLLYPALAGFLVERIEVWGVILIDFATFLFAVLTLLPARIPRPPITAAGEAGKGSLLREFVYGLNYLVARPGLMGMLVLFAILNFLMGFINMLVAPLVLGFATPRVLGTMMTVAGTGMLAGGLVMSMWGGPKRRIHGVLGFLMLAGLFISVGGLRPSIHLTTAAGFGFFFCVPFVMAASQAIWQSKVAPDVQGRVFATQRIVAIAAPAAMLLAGPLADYVFEPLLAVEGPLARSVGQIIGVGEGRGVGLMFILMGILNILVTVGGYLYPRLRLVEDELPDVIADQPSHDEPPLGETLAAGVKEMAPQV
jgi:DHA3 family macrolide efflux protein-like MFS transporter